jgi:hypothetical protein
MHRAWLDLVTVVYSLSGSLFSGRGEGGGGTSAKEISEVLRDNKDMMAKVEQRLLDSERINQAALRNISEPGTSDRFFMGNLSPNCSSKEWVCYLKVQGVWFRPDYLHCLYLTVCSP